MTYRNLGVGTRKSFFEDQTSELGPPAEGKEVGAGVSSTSEGRQMRGAPESLKQWRRHHRAPEAGKPG